MFLFANEEPSSIYGLISLVIGSMVSIITGYIAYMQMRAKQDAEIKLKESEAREKTLNVEADEAKSERENVQTSINEVYAQWKDIVVAIKLERDGIREDYKQKSIELMNAMVEVQVQKGEIASLKIQVQKLSEEIAILKGGAA